MEGSNPYRAPAAELSAPGLASVGTGGDLSGAVQAFSETKFWLRLISVAGFVVLGLVALAISLSIAFQGVGFVAGLGLLFVSMMLGVPLVQIHLYANAIDELVRHADPLTLERAVRRQKAFWTTFGAVIALALLLVFASSFLMVF